MVVPRARLLSLAKVCNLSAVALAPPWYRIRKVADTARKVQSNIFEQTFNPECKRLGNKVLRQRLRGPALASYYPRKTVSFRDLQDLYRPMGFDAVDPFEEMRQEHVE